MRIKIEREGICETLVSQLDRAARHNRQGSYHTKRRYYEAEKRFCTYLADEYRLQKLSNVSRKHLVSYVIYMLGRALAENRYDYILTLYLARHAGLRIHECFRIDTAIAEDALRENAITIKGGKIRTVPINEQIAAEKYQELVNGGTSDPDAHFTVSRLPGHEQADVTNIYPASVEGGNRNGV